MKDAGPPSLFGDGILPPPRRDYRQQASTLGELLHDGFYLLLLLKQGREPTDAAHFTRQLRSFLDDFDRQARRINAAAEDIHAAKFAFCATIDEVILASDSPIRALWERAPLQLILFDEHLAGETFFQRLDDLRREGAARIEALEVFLLCLLAGFRGRYMLESAESLNYLIATLDREIAHLKGKRAPFAPHWRSPDRIRHVIRDEIPAWAVVSAVVLFGALAYLGFDWMLARGTNQNLAQYFDLVKLPPKVPNLTISLP